MCVLGDARGRGFGHPFGLVLCSKLVDLAEKDGCYAAAFRFSRKFEEFWKVFPFPSEALADRRLTERIFFSDDPLAFFGEKKETLNKDPPTRAWLKQGNFFLVFFLVFWFFGS